MASPGTEPSKGPCCRKCATCRGTTYCIYKYISFIYLYIHSIIYIYIYIYIIDQLNYVRKRSSERSAPPAECGTAYLKRNVIYNTILYCVRDYIVYIIFILILSYYIILCARLYCLHYTHSYIKRKCST